MEQGDKKFLILFSFIFPLTLILWGIKESLNEGIKKIKAEGLLFNVFFLIAFLMLKYLSFIPLLGIVFSFLSGLFIWVYTAFVVIIIILKRENINREIPFITFYAEKLKER